jgi:hypothetical protein
VGGVVTVVAGAWVVVGAGPDDTMRVTTLFLSSGVPEAGSVRMTSPRLKSLLNSVRWAVRNPA